jgi:hypothetical protein
VPILQANPMPTFPFVSLSLFQENIDYGKWLFEKSKNNKRPL